MQTNTFNHRVEIILRDAEAIGMKEEFVKLMEKCYKRMDEELQNDRETAGTDQ